MMEGEIEKEEEEGINDDIEVVHNDFSNSFDIMILPKSSSCTESSFSKCKSSTILTTRIQRQQGEENNNPPYYGEEIPTLWSSSLTVCSSSSSDDDNDTNNHEEEEKGNNNKRSGSISRRSTALKTASKRMEEYKKNIEKTYRTTRDNKYNSKNSKCYNKRYDNCDVGGRDDEEMNKHYKNEDNNEYIEDDDDEEELLLSYLGLRAFHLPGNENNCCADYTQFMLNSHPLLGICCRTHKYHPIGTRMRLVALFGTFIFGLAITSITSLAFAYLKMNPNEVVFRFEKNAATEKITPPSSTAGSPTFNANALFGNNYEESTLFVITTSNLVLWTFGSGMHTLLDKVIWHATACACCLPGGMLSFLNKCRFCGSITAIIFVIAVTIATTALLFFRVVLINEGQEVITTTTSSFMNSNDYTNNTYYDTTAATDEFSFQQTSASEIVSMAMAAEITTVSAKSFNFVSAYFVELILVLFLFYPLTQTILFFGIPYYLVPLPCVPKRLRGRSYEIELEQIRREQEKEKEEKRRKRQQLKNEKRFQQQEVLKSKDTNQEEVEVLLSNSSLSSRTFLKQSSTVSSRPNNSSEDNTRIKYHV